MARVLIMHGWTNRRQENTWHRILVSALRHQGHQVLYPQFPSTDNPTLDEWQELLLAELALLEEAGPGEKVVIGHSLGCVNFLHAAVGGKIKHKIDRLLFVAPADPNLLGEIKGLNVDLAKPATKQALDAVVGSLTLVGSDADPWIPEGIRPTFAKPLGVDAVVIEGAGHFKGDEGWGKWQGLLDWVNDPASDITVR
jgi:predicted alpha/beta hydrolase family esterase